MAWATARHCRVDLDVRVPMRDGARLATSVYLPAADAASTTRYPVVLVRTAYNRIGSVATADHEQQLSDLGSQPEYGWQSGHRHPRAAR